MRQFEVSPIEHGVAGHQQSISMIDAGKKTLIALIMIDRIVSARINFHIDVIDLSEIIRKELDAGLLVHSFGKLQDLEFIQIYSELKI